MSEMVGSGIKKVGEQRTRHGRKRKSVEGFHYWRLLLGNKVNNYFALKELKLVAK